MVERCAVPAGNVAVAGALVAFCAALVVWVWTLAAVVADGA